MDINTAGIRSDGTSLQKRCPKENAEVSQENVMKEIIKSPLNISSAINIMPLEKPPGNSKSKLSHKIKYYVFYNYEF